MYLPLYSLKQNCYKKLSYKSSLFKQSNSERIAEKEETGIMVILMRYLHKKKLLCLMNLNLPQFFSAVYLALWIIALKADSSAGRSRIQIIHCRKLSKRKGQN